MAKSNVNNNGQNHQEDSQKDGSVLKNLLNIKIPDIKIPKITTKGFKEYSPSSSKFLINKPVNAPKKISYSDKELQYFKKIISNKLHDAKKDLLYLQDVLKKKNQIGENNELRIMTAEEGALNMEIDHYAQMASRTKKYIDSLEKALIRIRNKTYGICRVTGKLISKERLTSVPHATLSIDAKKNKHIL